MKIVEVYDDNGLMILKARVDEKPTRWFYWQGIPLAIVIWCLLSMW
jgi:hypothetical protein